MPALLLPNRILSLPAEAADRLLQAGSGDAALLYLGLLRHGEIQAARRALGWTDRRTADAFRTLCELALAEGSVEAVAAPEGRDAPPTYRRADLLASLTEHTAAMIEGRETLDEAVGAVQDDLALRFAERQ